VTKINTAGHDRNLVSRYPKETELSNLIPTRRDDEVCFSCHRRLNPDSVERAGIGLTLVAALDRAKGVKGDKERKVEPLGGYRGCPGRHPEMCVQDIWSLERQYLAEVVSEGAHVRPQVVLGNLLSRPGRNVYHFVSGGGG
jgi:hypothetical protein